MKPAEIVTRMADAGLKLSVSGDGNLKIKGDQSAIDSWLETIRENKPAILAELQLTAECGQVESDSNSATLHPFSLGHEVNLPSNLPLEAADDQQPFIECSTDSKYSVTVTDSTADPVLVEVTIRGQASFTLEIEQKYYDGLALLETLEEYNTQDALNDIAHTHPLPQAKECSHGHPGKQERAA